MLAPLCVRHREHIQRVVVVGILVAHQPEVRDRVIVAPRVDREGGGVQPSIHRLGRVLLGRCLAPADVQVKSDALVKFLFFGESRKDGLQELLRFPVPVTLERLNALLVHGDGFDVG